MRTQYEVVQSKIDSGKIRFTGGNGLTEEQAVVIEGAKSSAEGIPAEMIWISQKHGLRDVDWEMVSQGLSGNERKKYDQIEIRIMSTDDTVAYCFDISHFFGKN